MVEGRREREHGAPRERAPLRTRDALLVSALVGAAGGTVGFLYLGVLHALEHVLGPAARGPVAQLGVLAAAGCAVGWMRRRLGSPGDVELVVDNVHVLEGRSEPRTLRALVPMSLVCIASGGGAGPEAPLVQTAGTGAQWAAERLRLSGVDRRSLTIAGMAAAFTVLFGAPVGAALFALEILHRRGLMYHEALLPAVVAALVGYGVFVAASGLGLAPVWAFALERAPAPVDLAWAAGAGVVGAGVAVLFAGLVGAGRRALRGVPEAVRPAIGGVLLGLLGLASPFALTYGKLQVDLLLAAAGTAGFFALAALAKLAGTTVTVACGWRGGFIIPLFFIGAALARAAHALVPETNEAVLACALMAAASTGVTKTPLGSTLVVAKMAGLSVVPSTALAAVVALLLTDRVQVLSSQRPRSDFGGGGEGA